MTDHEPKPNQSPWSLAPRQPDQFEADPPPHLNRSRRRKYGKALIGSLAGGALLAGGIVGVDALNSRPDRHPPQTATTEQTEHGEAEQNVRDITEITTQPSAELRELFTNSIEGSACDTPQTAERAAQIYHEAFEAISYKDATHAELQFAANKLRRSLAQSRAKLEFGTLPASYDQLATDITSGDSALPISEYQTALKEIGVDAIYQWTAPQASSDENIPAANEAIALPASELADSRIPKEAIFAAINANAMIPRNIIDMTDGIRLYFGDLTFHPDAVGRAISKGFIYPDTERILIDVTDTWSHYTHENYLDIVSHESFHIHQNREIAICGALLHQAFTNQYPSGFTPHFEVGKTLQINLATEGGFTTLDNVDRALENNYPVPEDIQIVAANAYGATSVKEGVATLIGESLLNTTQTDKLFIAPKDSETIFAQLAIQVARFSDNSPEVADFYTQVLIAASLEREALNRQNKAEKNNDLETYDELEQMIVHLNNAQIGLPEAS